jgi:putative peptidoglycan lipid II flippase
VRPRTMDLRQVKSDPRVGASLVHAGRRAVSAGNRHVLTAVVTVAACTAIAKLAGAGKDLIFAQAFGISAALDTFLLAYLFPSVFVNVLAGSLQAAFVPKYMQERATKGDAAAAAFAASTASLLLLMLVAVAMVAAVIVGTVVPILAGKLPAEHVAQAQQMATVLMPVIVLNGLMYFWSGYLNTFNRFAVPALTPVVTPVCMASAALLFAPEYGVRVLVLSAFVGGSLELAIVLAGARRVTEGHLFAPPRLGAGQRAMLTQFAAAAAGNVVMGATIVVDQSFAASLGAGAVSTLSFGTKLSQVAASIFTMALASAILPSAARLAAERDWSALRRTLRTYTVLAIAATVPVAGVLVLFSEDIIRLLLERGAFRSSDTVAVAYVQSFSALQIPFYAWSVLIARVLAAISANGVLLFGAGISLLLDILLNYALVPILGVAGTGLATSVMYAFSCVFLSLALHYRLRGLEEKRLPRLPIAGEADPS